jgi:hypothetical protein
MIWRRQHGDPDDQLQHIEDTQHGEDGQIPDQATPWPYPETDDCHANGRADAGTPQEHAGITEIGAREEAASAMISASRSAGNATAAWIWKTKGATSSVCCGREYGQARLSHLER